MATGKQGIVKATEPQHSVSVQREKQMHVQPPVPAMYIQAVSCLPSYPQSQPTAVQDAAVIPLTVPMMYANQPLPLLTVHIGSGAGLQQQRPEPLASSSRPKSVGKHLCPHCGRDCLKPSVLEKHLRCHTGERPYPCPTCGISFKTQSNLYKHKRTQAHARLSSESGKESFSSQESTDSLRENCSSLSLDLQNEDSGDTNRNNGVLPAVPIASGIPNEAKTGSETEWALCKASVIGVIASPPHGQQVILHTMTQKAPQLSSDAASIQVKNTNGDGRAPMIPNRTPLQRQEALFPKSQSYDSTDSGFSESSEHHSTSSPGATVSDPSMDQEETSEKLSDVGHDDINSKVRNTEKQELEKHILKLISENSIVMDDKHLVNVRPRKTMLSKQGSIDLPMPYTYKDSFHFEIRSSKHQVSGSQKQDRNCRAFYSSMPTQHSTSMEHAPITRSSSLPFSMGIQTSDSTVSPYQVDNVPLSRRCSAGQINPFKSVDQHTPNHRSLVRQVAVDGLPVVEGCLMERGMLSSLSSDGYCTDTASESAVKRCRKKKAEKFSYNKWYMYGGGTFKKLYNTEKESVLKSRKSTVSPEQVDSQGIQRSQQKDNSSSAAVTGSYTSSPASSLSPVFTEQVSSPIPSSYVLVQNTPMKQATGQPQQSLTKQTNAPTSDLSTVMNARKDTETKGRAPEIHISTTIPSERKKQKTDEHFSVLVENTDFIRMQQTASRQVTSNLSQSIQSECGDMRQKSGLSSGQLESGVSLNRHGSFTNLSSSSRQRQLLFKRHSSPLFVANMSGTSASPSVSSSISSVSQAKTSFLPKYQLKIPVLTDGMTDPCLGKGSLPNPSSPRQNVSLNQHPSTASPSSPQNQATITVMSPKQGQGTLCITAVTKLKSLTSSVLHCQNADSYTATYTSATSVSLASPLAFTDVSVTANTTQSSVSSVSPSSTSTKNIQVHAGNVGSVQANLVSPTQSSGVTPTPVPLSSKEGTPFEISSTEIHGSQDTFYMQTADLQIFMQLISDEQLALIEPQIETQDYKTNEGHCFFSNDPETSGIGTIQTGVSQEKHKQCSGDTGAKLAVDEGNVNRSVLSNVPDITLISTESTGTNYKAKCTKSAKDVYLTNTGTKGVISRSPSKSEYDVSASLDSKTLGQQCKLLGSTPEDSMVPKDPETLGCSVKSYPKQIASEKSKKPLADKSSGSRSSAYNQIPSHFSTSIKCNIHQSCQDNTHSRGFSPPIVSSTNNADTSSEGKWVKVKVAPTELSKKSPNFQPLQMTVQKDKPLVRANSAEKQSAESNTSCISGASSVLGLLQTSSSNHDEPSQPESCQPSNTSMDTAGEISSQNVLACRLCPQQPLNQTGACGGDNPTYAESQTSTLGQSGQNSTQEVWSKIEEVRTITPITAHMAGAQFNSHGPVVKCHKEEDIKSALGPGGMVHVIQDSFTGPPVSCSVQRLKFHWEAGTATGQTWIPLEGKNRGRDRAERAGTCGVRNTWTEQEEEVEEAVAHKREETKCTEVSHKVVKPHLDLSTSHHVTNVSVASSELVSIRTTPAVCGISNTSPVSKCLTNKAHRGHSLSANVSPKHIDQSNTHKKEHVSSGRFTALPKEPGDMRHLLAHPLLVNCIQEEVQKETHTKNSLLTDLTSTQVKCPAQETHGGTHTSLLNKLPCNTEQCQIKKNTPTYTRPSCSIQTSSSCIHSNPSCTSGIHSKPPEPSDPHSYKEEEEAEEEEEGRSSSSDDEGKLVIELE